MSIKLDSSKRLAIPLAFYKQMGNPKHVVVMRESRDKGLILMPGEKLEKFVQSIYSDPSFHFGCEMDTMLKRLCAHIEILALDARRRIRIPDKLLDYAGLKSNVVMIGAITHIKLMPLESIGD